MLSWQPVSRGIQMMSSLTAPTLKEISSLKRRPFVSSQYTDTQHNIHTSTHTCTHVHTDTYKHTHTIVEPFDRPCPCSPFVINLSWQTEAGIVLVVWAIGCWSYQCVCVHVCVLPAYPYGIRDTLSVALSYGHCRVKN